MLSVILACFCLTASGTKSKLCKSCTYGSRLDLIVFHICLGSLFGASVVPMVTQLLAKHITTSEVIVLLCMVSLDTNGLAYLNVISSERSNSGSCRGIWSCQFAYSVLWDCNENVFPSSLLLQTRFQTINTRMILMQEHEFGQHRSLILWHLSLVLTITKF